MNKTKILTENDIIDLLENRFCPPAWAFLPQVRNGTGYLRTTRTADAIAMGLWPSRGLYLNGFEIKVRRSDWFAELKNPEKAEEIASFCDYWWIVAPKDMVRVDELPSLWGLMIPHGTTTKIIKEAKPLKAKPIDKLFLAAILRRTQEVVTPQAKLNEEFKDGEKKGKEVAQKSFKWQEEEHRELKETVRKFEKISGVKIDCGWRLEESAEAVKMVLNGEHLRIKQQLKNLLEKSQKITEDIKKELGQDVADKCSAE